MENIFNTKYQIGMDKLKIQKEKQEHKIIKLIKKNKFISLILANLIILSGINFYLIYSFIKILENI